MVENQHHCKNQAGHFQPDPARRFRSRPCAKTRAAPKDRPSAKQDRSFSDGRNAAESWWLSPSVASESELAQLKRFDPAHASSSSIGTQFVFLSSLLSACSHIAELIKLDPKECALMATALPNCSWLDAEATPVDSVESSTPLFTVLSFATPVEARNAVKALKGSKFHTEDRFRALLWHEASEALRLEPRRTVETGASVFRMFGRIHYPRFLCRCQGGRGFDGSARCPRRGLRASGMRRSHTATSSSCRAPCIESWSTLLLLHLRSAVTPP